MWCMNSFLESSDCTLQGTCSVTCTIDVDIRYSIIYSVLYSVCTCTVDVDILESELKWNTINFAKIIIYSCIYLYIFYTFIFL